MAGDLALLPVLPRGILRLAGADRVRFLQGMTTNHVKALKPGESQRSLHVSQKGKVLALLTVLAEVDFLWVETDADRAAWLKAALEKMLIMDDVIIEDCSSGLAVLALLGRHPPPLTSPTLRRVRASRVGGDGWELWVPRVELGAQRPSLLEAGARLIGAEEEELLRMERGMPRFNVDVSEENLPQEARLDEDTGWISYSKGCYVGQETIARLHSMGQVRQRLALLRMSERALPGSPVHAVDQLVGRVTSASGLVALAMLRREWTSPGSLLEVETPSSRISAEVIAFSTSDTKGSRPSGS